METLNLDIDNDRLDLLPDIEIINSLYKRLLEIGISDTIAGETANYYIMLFPWNGGKQPEQFIEIFINFVQNALKDGKSEEKASNKAFFDLINYIYG